MVNVAEFIRTKRKELGMTQGELAAKTGVHQPYISRIESDMAGDITLDNLERILVGLGYRVDVLPLDAGELMHNLKPEKWPENGKGENYGDGIPPVR